MHLLSQKFNEAVELYKRMRARFDQRQEIRNEYELLVKFDEQTYDLFGLYQQVVVGDINVPSKFGHLKCFFKRTMYTLLQAFH